jgi:hypothetical protein
MRDNLLLKKALKLNLDKNEQVLKELDKFMAEQSYDFYHNKVLDKLDMPFFVYNYFQISKESRLKAPDHPLARFHNLEDWRWWRAQRDLHKSLRDDKPDIWINQKLLRQENNHIDWNYQIRLFMVLKPS